MKKQKELAIILIPALILTILWVFFNVYHSYTSSTIKDPLNILIVPIEGSFDHDTIDEIKNRKRVDASTQIIIELPDAITEENNSKLNTSNKASNSADINSGEGE